ncbi:MAG: flagellar hook-associated protein FlgK, partial [Oscillospiraceae bacterium]|nr:flagellar hook-associated protein FlgK [Oscillospiraceae bacterium]
GTGHAGGHQVGSSPGDPPSGIRFFTLKGDGRKAVTTDFFLNDNGQIGQMPNDVNSPEYIAAVIERYKNVTAKNFSVSWDVLDDPTLISTMDSPGEVGNNRVLLALLNQRNDIHLFTEGKTEDFMKSLIGGMGIDSQKCAMFLSSQRLMMNQLTNKRLSISGVSEIEESANMVRFLNVFNSSAKMVQVFNEVYDTLINRLGLM